MARIRTVKPELFRHEELFEAERETGFPLRIAFVGMFTVCDKEGRFKWRPRNLKLDVLPYDDIDFSRVLDALMTRGFLVKYRSNTGELFGCIPSFKDHQHINNREVDSVIPDLSECEIIDNEIIDMSISDPRVLDACSTRQENPSGEYGREGNMEGKGKEGERKGDIVSSLRSETQINDTLTVTLAEKKNSTLTTTEVRDKRFPEFWMQWPKKEKRKTALEIWKRKRLDTKADSIIADVLWRKANCYKWVKGYIPNVTTYLNQELWNDERISTEQAINRKLTKSEFRYDAPDPFFGRF